MMFQFYFPILFSVLFSHPMYVVAEEIWQCSNHRTNSQMYTSAPVRSSVTNCLPSTIDRASYSVTANIKNAYGQSVATSSAAHTNTKVANEQIASAKSKIRESPKAADPRAVPFVNWKAEEKTKSRTDGVRCAIHGEAGSEIGGSGMLLVRRGGAQLDRFPLLLKGRYAATRWQIELAGPCRNPEVQLKAP